MHRTSIIGDDTDQSLHAVADHRVVSRSAAGEPSVIQFQAEDSRRPRGLKNADASGSGKLPTEFGSRFPVCVGGKFDVLKTAKDNSSALMSDAGAPSFVGIVPMNAFDTTGRLFMDSSVASALPSSRSPQIVRPVIGGITVDVIDDTWNGIEIGHSGKSVNDPVDHMHPTANADAQTGSLSFSVESTGDFPGENLIPSFSVPREMMIGPGSPADNPGFDVEVETFGEVFEGDIFEFHYDDPVSIGELAIKLVADWSLPKIVCWRGSYEEG